MSTSMQGSLVLCHVSQGAVSPISQGWGGDRADVTCHNTTSLQELWFWFMLQCISPYDALDARCSSGVGMMLTAWTHQALWCQV